MLEPSVRIDLQALLNERFPANQTKQRDAGFGGKKLDYIPIDKVYQRFNEIFPLAYDWELLQTLVTEKGIIIVGRLTLKMSDGSEIIREGVGADSTVGDRVDLDKACKTAMAEAFKKASHTLGVGLYLWDSDERVRLHNERVNEANPKKVTQFTPKQISESLRIRTALNIAGKENETKFNDLVKEFSDAVKCVPGMTTKNDLCPANIDGFLAWCRINKLNEKA